MDSIAALNYILNVTRVLKSPPELVELATGDPVREPFALGASSSGSVLPRWRYWSFLGFLLSVLLLAVVQAAVAAEITGRVVGITDGDTLTVLNDAKQPVKIRLSDIDAPESHQPYGSRAKQTLFGSPQHGPAAERHGSHSYTAEDFGLSEDQLARDFAFYTEAYL